MPVASTLTPEAPARNALSCAAVSVPSATDFVTSHANASFASSTRSLSSSASQALPCASSSQFAWSALATDGQLSVLLATPQAIAEPAPKPSPSVSA